VAHIGWVESFLAAKEATYSRGGINGEREIMNLFRIVGLASVSFAALVETALAGTAGVPGPIVGVGLPALVLIGGAYWVGRKLFGG
jgi:hypothetical protein